MDDPELDYWPMSVWADPEHELHDRLVEELADATSMDDDEMAACFAFLQTFGNRFPDGQYIAEQIERLFEDHLVATYTSWGHFAELWADACRSDGAVNGMLSAARDLGHQDVFFEILDQWGQDISLNRDHEHLWFFHVATLLDGRVFCLERPKP